jgi:hypothetical protein
MRRKVSWFPYALVNTDALPDLQLLYEDEPEWYRAYITYMLRKKFAKIRRN